MTEDNGDHTVQPSTSVATTEGRGAPWAFVAAVLALGLLAGFTIGLVAFKSSGPGEPGSPLYDEKLVSELFNRAGPAVVEIQVSREPAGDSFRSLFPDDTGSGFFVDRKGLIVTNHHVVDGGVEIKVTLADGRTLPATRLGSSPADDLALLRVDPAETGGIEPLRLADSDKIRPGQMAIAIGSPFRMKNFMSVGVVSGVGQSPPILPRPIPNMIWTDAALNPGNSGGPLLNRDGEVIGVTSAVQISQSAQIGIGFAVPSNIVSNLLPALASGGEVRRAWLGISGTSLSKNLSESLGIGVDKGVYVRQVLPGTPAERARLQGDPLQVPSGQGDVIVAVDGGPVASVADIVHYFNSLRPGSDVVLTIYRGSGTQEVKVTLTAWPGT